MYNKSLAQDIIEDILLSVNKIISRSKNIKNAETVFGILGENIEELRNTLEKILKDLK